MLIEILEKEYISKTSSVPVRDGFTALGQAKWCKVLDFDRSELKLIMSPTNEIQLLFTKAQQRFGRYKTIP